MPPAPRSKPGDKSAPLAKSDPLPVVEVGSFEASFVPAIKDFDRLDARFRLPGGVWEKLPQYKEFGFAVFKLKKGEKKVHPMAFEFPRADKDVLFFPTVHIHDGTVPTKATFDHTLYCQVASEPPVTWDESPALAGEFMKASEAKGMIDADAHVYRKIMRGMHANKDVGI